jgi:hypothetical protein
VVAALGEEVGDPVKAASASAVAEASSNVRTYQRL